MIFESLRIKIRAFGISKAIALKNFGGYLRLLKAASVMPITRQWCHDNYGHLLGHMTLASIQVLFFVGLFPFISLLEEDDLRLHTFGHPGRVIGIIDFCNGRDTDRQLSYQTIRGSKADSLPAFVDYHWVDVSEFIPNCGDNQLVLSIVRPIDKETVQFIGDVSEIFNEPIYPTAEVRNVDTEIIEIFSPVCATSEEDTPPELDGIMDKHWHFSHDYIFTYKNNFGDVLARPGEIRVQLTKALPPDFDYDSSNLKFRDHGEVFHKKGWFVSVVEVILDDGPPVPSDYAFLTLTSTEFDLAQELLDGYGTDIDKEASESIQRWSGLETAADFVPAFSFPHQISTGSAYKSVLKDMYESRSPRGPVDEVLRLRQASDELADSFSSPISTSDLIAVLGAVIVPVLISIPIALVSKLIGPAGCGSTLTLFIMSSHLLVSVNSVVYVVKELLLNLLPVFPALSIGLGVTLLIPVVYFMCISFPLQLFAAAGHKVDWDYQPRFLLFRTKSLSVFLYIVTGVIALATIAYFHFIIDWLDALFQVALFLPVDPASAIAQDQIRLFLP